MAETGLTVLFVNAQLRCTPSLMAHLEQRGCICRLATSHEEALRFIRKDRFDLVLSQMSLSGLPSHPLINLLEGSPTTLFFQLHVVDGSWWLPAVRNGQRCLGTAALQNREFMGLLDEVLREALDRGTRVATAKPWTRARQRPVDRTDSDSFSHRPYEALPGRTIVPITCLFGCLEVNLDQVQVGTIEGEQVTVLRVHP